MTKQILADLRIVRARWSGVMLDLAQAVDHASSTPTVAQHRVRPPAHGLPTSTP
jgi:hypothetical protein